MLEGQVIILYIKQIKRKQVEEWDQNTCVRTQVRTTVFFFVLLTLCTNAVEVLRYTQSGIFCNGIQSTML